MAKHVIKITHLVWRDGRPRFVPAAGLRKLGYKGLDLKHPDGRWYDLQEAKDWSDDLQKDIKDRRNAIKDAAPKRTARKNRNAPLTVIELIDRCLHELNLDSLKTGKPSQGTISYYRTSRNSLERFDQEFTLQPAAAISNLIAGNLYREFSHTFSTTKSRNMVSVLRRSYSWGVEQGLCHTNPFSKVKVKQPAPRVRWGTVDEIRHLLKTADAMNMPHIGDMIAIACCTGQRQNDRFALQWEQVDGDIIRIRQKKTGALVDVVMIDFVTERIQRARDRQSKAGIQRPEVLFDEARNRRWSSQNTSNHYWRDYRRVLEQAAKTIPSLADLRDQDLRDTAVTWLANAGATEIEIAAVTGHSLKSVSTILKHYLARTEEQARNASAKLADYLKNSGGLS